MSGAPALDQFQQKVVASDSPSIRMVAPAGSGKTETLARRIQARIAAGIEPGRILLLTFDNNARLSALRKLQALGVPESVRVSTLNAFGYHLLNTRFTDERRRVVREVYFPTSPVLGELVTEYGHSVFTEMLAKIKNAAIDPRTTDVGDLAVWCRENREHLLRDLEDDPILEDVSDVRFGRELAKEMLGYEQFLEQKNGIDFDDQKLRPLIRLQQDDRALQHVQQAFDDVIVDEFQDINLLDVKLINLIAGQASLLITGDDDQAIYGFRGATARYLIHPEQELHRTFASFELAINYRCPPRILDAAGRLIDFNVDRIPKRPKSSKKTPGEIEICKAKDPDSESEYIAKRMKDLLNNGAPSAAVLVRRRSQLPGIQSAMIREGTPYRIDLHEDLRVTWGLAVRALKVAPLRRNAVPDAETRAEIVRIFGQARNFDRNRIEQLANLAMLDDRAFPGPELLQGLFERDQKELAEGIKALVGEMSLFTRLRSLDGLLNARVRTYMDGGKAEERDRADRDASKLSGLVDMAAEKGVTSNALIARLEKLLAMQRPAFRGDIPTVELATCHGAKGREWQVVCIPHCNYGVFPDSRSAEGEYLESERKLFYVSMTRASEHLICTWSTERRDEPGVFLLEAGLVEARKAPSAGKVTTFTANSPKVEQPQPATRKLTPDGSWAMRASPTKISGPVPRFITLATPRIRLMQNALEIESTPKLADEIERQHSERNTPYDQMRVLYSRADAASTVPMQVEMALRGVPFAITETQRFPDSVVFQTAMQAWAADAAPKCDKRDIPLVDALAATLERITASDDAWVWLDRLEQLLEDESIGGEGVQFVAQ